MRQREQITKTVDPDTKAKIASLDGVAGCNDATDGTDNLIVDLVKDLPEVREAVLAVIGDKLPKEKVVFNETGSYCTMA